MSVVAQQRKPLGQVTENEALSRQERLMQWRAAKKPAGSANVIAKPAKEKIAAPRPAPAMARNAPVANLPTKPAVPRVAAAPASAAKRPPFPKPAPTGASKKVPIAAKKAGIPPRVAPRPITVKPAPAPAKVAIAKKPTEVVVSAVTATTNRPPVAKMNVVSSTNLWQKKHKKTNVKAAKAGKEMTLDEDMFPALDELDDAPLGGDLPDEADILRIEVKELRSIIDQQNDDISSLKIKLAEKEKECEVFRAAATAVVAIVEEQRQTEIAAIDKYEQLSSIEPAVEAAPVPMFEEISSTEVGVDEAHKDDDSVPSTDVVASSDGGVDSSSTVAPEQSVAAISEKAADATEDIAEPQHTEEESDKPAAISEENRDAVETAADNALADSLVSLDDVNASVSSSNLGDLSFDFSQDE